MKIYFAGAIRGGRADAEIYLSIIKYMQTKGQVLTEHVGSSEMKDNGEPNKTDQDIFQRDLEWLQSADIIVAEVTTPSLGVGYELGIAEKLNIPVLCIYRLGEDKRLSAMVAGNKNFTCNEYESFEGLKTCIDKFLNSLS